MDFDFDLAPKPAPTQGFPAFQWFKASRDPQSAGVVGFRDQIPPYFEAEARRMGFQTRQVMVDAGGKAAFWAPALDLAIVRIRSRWIVTNQAGQAVSRYFRWDLATFREDLVDSVQAMAPGSKLESSLQILVEARGSAVPFVISFRGKGATTPLLNVIKGFEVGVVGMANTFRPDGANPLPLYAFYLPLVVSTPEKVGSGKATRVFQPALASMPSDIDREYCLSRYVGRAALERMNALANESQTWQDQWDRLPELDDALAGPINAGE